MTRNRSRDCAIISLAAMVASAAISSAAAAQDNMAAVGDGETIVVTAQKREQQIQDVPASVQAFDGAALARAGISNLDDLQFLTPGLSITPFQSESQLFIRGIGNNVNAPGLDPSNAVHLNGVYLSRPSLALLDFHDIERVEVLKGPQGTLYGRNATGGAVNIITARPSDDPDYRLTAGVGNLGARRVEAMANLPVGPGAIRLSGLYSADDGYTNNIVDDRKLDFTDTLALRGRARFELGGGFSVEGGLDWTRDDGNVGLPLRNNPDLGGPYLDLPGNATGPRDYSLDGDTDGRQEALVADLQLVFEGEAITVRAISGYLDFRIGQNVDTDGTSLPLEQLRQQTDTRMFTQEVQLLGQVGQQVDWIVGGFFLTEQSDHDSLFELAFEVGDPREALFDDVSRIETDAWAIFAEGTVRLGGGFGLTLGGRYTSEVKRARIEDRIFGDTDSARATFDAFTPRAILTWSPDDRLNAYASVSRGFKSGGFSGLGGFLDAFGDERVTAYELGVKGVSADGALRVNGALFHNDYRGAQIFALEEAGVGGFVTVPVNLPKARSTGFELDAQWRIDDVFRLRGGYTFLDTEIESDIILPSEINGRGLPLPNAPRHQLTLGAEALQPLGKAGNLRWSIDYALQDEWLAPVFQNPVTETLPGFGLLNAGVAWESEDSRFFASLVGRNITNKTYPTYRADFTSFAAVLEYNGVPRTVLFSVGIRR